MGVTTTRAGRGRKHCSKAVVVLGLDHVQVAAPPGSESAARRYYGGLLGLAEIQVRSSAAGQANQLI